MSIMQEAYFHADQIIQLAKNAGKDYSAAREVIAQHFDDIVFNGNYDTYLDLEGFGLPTMRIMQEDEYDQSMPEDEKPDWDDINFDAGGYYIILET